MRLLDTSTLQFQEFWGGALPRYAILSHTWEDGEVSFHEMRDGTGKEKAGYSKILDSCTLAAKDGWKYVWVDTCCIDKTSSAELSEAINSIFQWYAKAEVCYAYLSDVPILDNNRPRTMRYFNGSRWFTRGWTLQELLAPSVVIFYGQRWKEIGTKSSLLEEISSRTGIAPSDVVGFRRTKSVSNKEANVAVKMSWASKRETTRIEDTAYCLFGIFDVNMPLLYGEGNAAFTRLQLEILKMSDDETIFAWEKFTPSGTGLLASSPAAFRGSGCIRQVLFDRGRPEYSMTNKGLRIEFLLSQAGTRRVEISPSQWDRPMWKGGEVDAAVLNCTKDPDDRPLEIYLRRDVINHHGADESSISRTEPMQFSRIHPDNFHPGLGIVSDSRREDYLTRGRTTVYVKQNDAAPDRPRSFQHSMVSIRYPLWFFRKSELWPPKETDTFEENGGCITAFAATWQHLQQFGIVFESRNHPESFAILVTNPQGPLGDIAVTAAVVRSQWATFRYGRIVQFFDSKKSRDLRIHSGQCDRIQLLDGELMTWGRFNRTCRFDRISKLLPSGSSVSVSVRPHALAVRAHHTGGRTYDNDSVKQWVIDITVDSNGGLPWPPRIVELEEEEAGEESPEDAEILSRLAYDLCLHPLQLQEVAS